MISMDLDWLAKTLGISYQGSNSSLSNINTDTRTLCDGEVFLALQGPNFDGHNFIDVAERQGAVAVIVAHPVETHLPQLVVADTRIALGQIGAAVKAEVAPKTIAITGSVGKTTVKEMCAAILAQKGSVLATKGNFNNDIGVPLTLLRLEPQHQYAVIELGANHLGEIAYTTALTKPDVAVVCNVAEAHLEGFGSLQGVATAKGEIFTGLAEDGVAVINADSEFKQQWLDGLGTRQVKQFSTSEHLDVWAEEVTLDALARPSFMLCNKDERVAVTLAMPGQHNVTNVLIAAALTSSLGCSLADVASGLANMAQVKGRVNIIEVTSQLTVIDDTYNANVRSVQAAIDLLAQVPGYRVLALGDMNELGEGARQYHQQVGEYAKQKGIEAVYSLGVLSRYASDVYEQAGRHFSGRDQLLEQMLKDLRQTQQKITVVVKGSRSSRMELLVEDLVAHGKQLAGEGEK
ncbi:UDP-N-acetylmuramoyl-tripeptide--D-alanyl-D-alanine ligase [Pseudoalteromonas sp. BDTF-M6]|uniref:UDP-N-acetylmuramoyl-tripeptide--D-alanyl-D- alanine ligase n=1 Tax=Pseudoalteromonas sp. BDTF-M6 TaxID=2796132 RepID=UPI001BAE73CB|nr:UDP-N-acetylmuramoyl-tripeptide--D-alanyl-D-alanine ligase [Pseudoalteromonas sp. BDTF-M6]MBS3798524.1 UDP-N-acetylmuramoyl-tripeptide--D-alanyl-D-alanine ligase [Pseudoalteromonas sp. BDTF-M6]